MDCLNDLLNDLLEYYQSNMSNMEYKLNRVYIKGNPKFNAD